VLVPTAPGFVTITRASVRRGSSMLRAVDRLNLSIARAGGAGGRVGRWKDRRGARHPAIAGARQRIDTLRGTDITHLEKPALRPLRRRMQMIFRALNPRLKVRDIIEEAFVIHGIGTRRDRHERAVALLDRVGLPADAMERYPHEFSGGQR
jgi:ABC-type microcin C transport system duplicated ATPase subunit YejF